MSYNSLYLAFQKKPRIFLFEHIFRNISFRYFLIIFADAFVCDAKLEAIICTDKVVDMLFKCLSSFFPCVVVLIKQSIS